MHLFNFWLKRQSRQKSSVSAAVLSDQGSHGLPLYLHLSKLLVKCSGRYCQMQFICWRVQVRIQRGGQGVQTPPPGKSQVIWVSIGNKQLDPPWKKLDPPPGKCWTPSGTLKNDKFLWNWPFDFCKIGWGLKKEKKRKKNFVRAFLSDWPGPPPPPPPPADENSWNRAWRVWLTNKVDPDEHSPLRTYVYKASQKD